MFFLIGLLLLILVLDVVAMYWGYDSRDRLESKEWEHRYEQVWSKGHLAFRPTRSKQPRSVTRPSLNHVYTFGR